MRLLLISFFLLSINSTLYGQDTLAINLDQFLELSLKNAGQLKLANNDIKLAKNRRQQTEDQRFLPKLDYKCIMCLKI